MIVLKILLWIILALIGLIIVICILPVGGEFSYIDGKLSYKVKLWLLNVMDSDGGGLLGWLKKRKANKKPKPVKDKKKKKQKEPEPVSAENILPDEEVPPDSETLLPEELPEAEEVSADELSPDEIAAFEDIAADEALLTMDGGDNNKKEKKKKKSRRKKEAEETYYEFDDADEGDDEEEEPKKSLSDKIGFLIDIWNSAKRPLRTILKGFKFSDVYIDFLLADEDASQCAVKYGRFSGIFFNGFRVFSDLFTVRLKTVDVRPGFGTSQSKWDATGKLKFRLGTAVIAGVWFLITYIFRVLIPNKLRARKAKKLKKAAAAQE